MSTASSGTTVFRSVRCEASGDGQAPDFFTVEVTDGLVTIGDGCYEIDAAMTMMVCKGRHADRRVKLTFQENGRERTLYLSDCGLRAKLQGNRHLYQVVHDALIAQPDGVAARV